MGRLQGLQVFLSIMNQGYRSLVGLITGVLRTIYEWGGFITRILLFYGWGLPPHYDRNKLPRRAGVGEYQKTEAPDSKPKLRPLRVQGYTEP